MSVASPRCPLLSSSVGIPNTLSLHTSGDREITTLLSSLLYSWAAPLLESLCVWTESLPLALLLPPEFSQVSLSSTLAFLGAPEGISQTFLLTQDPLFSKMALVLYSSWSTLSRSNVRIFHSSFPLSFSSFLFLYFWACRAK